jgi:hypothetical protein
MFYPSAFSACLLPISQLLATAGVDPNVSLLGIAHPDNETKTSRRDKRIIKGRADAL